MAGEGTSLRELLATFGFRVDTAALDTADRSLVGLITQASRFGNMLIGGVVATGIARWVQSTIDAGSELHDMSEQTGLSATELTEWRYAARLAGVESGQLAVAMARTAVIAQRQPQALRRLGVATRDANGELRRTSDLFEDAGVAIGALENDTERTAAATALFGRQGRALLPMFRQGRAGIAGLRAEVRRLYGTDLERLSELSDRAGDAQDHFNLVLDATSTRLSVSVLPYLADFLEMVANGASAFYELAAGSSVAQAALVTLGIIAAAVALATIELWGPPLLLFGLIAGAIGIVILVMDDLITMFRGGNSVIATFLDTLFGVGTARTIVQTLTEAWEGLTLAVRDAGNAVAEFLGHESTTTAGGLATRADHRGIRPGDGQVGAAQSEYQQLYARTLHGETIDPAERERIVGAYRDFLAQRRGEMSAAPGGAGGVSVSRTIGSVTMHIDGSTDPETTGRAVRDALERAGDGEVDDAAHDLIPAGAA